MADSQPAVKHKVIDNNILAILYKYRDKKYRKKLRVKKDSLILKLLPVGQWVFDKSRDKKISGKTQSKEKFSNSQIRDRKNIRTEKNIGTYITTNL